MSEPEDKLSKPLSWKARVAILAGVLSVVAYVHWSVAALAAASGLDVAQRWAEMVAHVSLVGVGLCIFTGAMVAVMGDVS